MKRLTEISWDILPANFEDFIADAKEKMSEPESAAALFVVALKMYMESPEEGKKCLDFITYKSPSEFRHLHGKIHPGRSPAPVETPRYGGTRQPH